MLHLVARLPVARTRLLVGIDVRAAALGCRAAHEVDARVQLA